MDSCKGIVHSLESFGSADGPGIRFVVFLAGCPMRCGFCHNPDTWGFNGESYTPEALFERAWRCRSYWGKDYKKGGVTVSGGEPLLQIEFVTAFFKLLKAKGVPTALDTSGQPFSKEKSFLRRLDALLKYTDLVLLDLKEMDSEKHKALTGHSNQNILDFAKYLSESRVPLWIRHVLVPGVTDDEASLKALREFVRKLSTVERVEVIPYHTLGTYKWERLGLDYPLKGVPTPTEAEIQRAEEILKIKDGTRFGLY